MEYDRVVLGEGRPKVWLLHLGSDVKTILGPEHFHPCSMAGGRPDIAFNVDEVIRPLARGPWVLIETTIQPLDPFLAGRAVGFHLFQMRSLRVNPIASTPLIPSFNMVGLITRMSGIATPALKRGIRSLSLTDERFDAWKKLNEVP